MKIRNFIKQHFEKALQRGYIPLFQAAAAKYDFPVELLMGIASRETNMTNMKGDFRKSKHFSRGGYHGYGIMQVDIGTDPDWINTGGWQRVDESIMRGTKILNDKRNQLNKEWPHARPRTLAQFFWVLAASYNQGAAMKGGALGDFVRLGNPDATTTGKDYGRDVLGRMAEFAWLLASRGLLAPMPANVAEVQLEGQETGIAGSLEEPVETLEIEPPNVWQPALEIGLPDRPETPETQPEGHQAQPQATTSTVVEKAETVVIEQGKQSVANKPGTQAGEPGIVVKKERPGILARLVGIGGLITSTLTAYNLDWASIMSALRNQNLSLAQVAFLLVLVLLILGMAGLGVWFWNQSANRAAKMTEQKMRAAADQTAINIETQ